MKIAVPGLQDKTINDPKHGGRRENALRTHTHSFTHNSSSLFAILNVISPFFGHFIIFGHRTLTAEKSIM